MAIHNTSILTTNTIIFTCPGAPTTDEREYAVTCIMFCNNSPITDITLTLHYVTNASSVSPTNMVINNLIIPAGETFTFDTEKIILSTGDTIAAIASVSPNINGLGLNATVSTMRVS